MNHEELVIVTVAGPDSFPIINRNAELIKRKNRNSKFSLYVVDNSKFSGGKAIPETDNWNLIQGVALPDKVKHSKNFASLHHARAINKFFKEIKIQSKYCLIIDPDFYVLKDEWIKAIIENMNKKERILFGAPWHPRWFTKYRYFPCSHFFLFNTHMLPSSSLDFSPPFMSSSNSGQNKNRLKKIIGASRILRILYSLTLLRRQIGKSKDTGILIYEKLGKKMIFEESLELLNPVSGSKDFQKVDHLDYKIGRLIEHLIPEAVSYIPKSKNYMENQSNLPSDLKSKINKQEWEEFSWNGDLFGVHMRNFPTNMSDINRSIQLLDELISI